MIKQQQISVNRYRKETRGYFNRSAVLVGSLAAILVIAVGRLTLASTSSSLSGWTALFFTALCVGLAFFNLLAEHPFTSQRQMLCLTLGSLSGVAALVLLEENLDSAGDGFLFSAGLLLAMSLVGLRQRKSLPHAFQARTLANWALRLDDLLKYDLPTGTRNALNQLIDALWCSPQDHTDFIPAQNATFADLLTHLELMIRQDDIKKTTKTLDDLAACLAERNHILATTIKIEYRDTGKELPRLNQTPPEKRMIKDS